MQSCTIHSLRELLHKENVRTKRAAYVQKAVLK